MKRIWIGLGLMGLLLGLGLLTARRMERVQTAVSHRLALAAQATQWEEATALSREAEAQWQQHRRFTAALANHNDMDEVDRLFAQLEVYRRRGDTLSHAGTCAYLSEAVTAIKEVHRFRWWNLL